jgi:hypothetical protein
MSSETRLSELWALDAPPARDPAFVHATLARVVRRRFWMDVAHLVPMTIAFGVVCGVVAPALEALPRSGELDGALTVLAAGLALAGLWMTDDGRPERLGL